MKDKKFNIYEAAKNLHDLTKAHEAIFSHEHRWRVIRGNPVTGDPEVEACDICNEERWIWKGSIS